MKTYDVAVVGGGFAGVGAALAVGLAAKAHTDVHSINVKQLQATLKRHDAFIGI